MSNDVKIAVQNNETIETEFIKIPMVDLPLGATEDRVCGTIDIEKALTIMQEEVAKHPLFIDTRTPQNIQENTPLVVARVIALADSSVSLKTLAWAKNTSEGFILYCDLLQSIKKRFDEANISIPYTQREITIKNLNNQEKEVNDTVTD